MMNTIIYDLKDENNRQNFLDQAASVILSGGIVAFPTETVYGLGANAFDPIAVSKIFRAKGRPSDNPLIVHVSDIDMMRTVAAELSDDALTVIDMYMPGPLTIVVNKQNKIPDIVSAGLKTVGIRIPDMKVTRDFIKRCGVPIAAPSANLSGKPSPTSPQHVIDDLYGKVEMILTGPSCRIGVESTVLDLSERPYRILRPGSVTWEMLSGLIPVEKTSELKNHDAVRSPGMKYAHYKPKASVIAMFGDDDRVSQYILSRIQSDSERNAGLLFSDYLPDKCNGHLFDLGGKSRPEEAAKMLYSYFRMCDDLHVQRIYVMCPEDRGVGSAFLNRLLKAADEQIHLEK